MCFQTIPVLSQPRSKNTHRRQRNPANLRPINTYSTTPLSFFCGSWNCQSAVNKSWLHSAFSFTIHSSESWAWLRPGFRPERLRYPGCSLSQFLFLSHPQGKLAGVGALVCSFQTMEILNPLSPRQSQLIWISCDYCTAPIKLQIVIIYRPPGQILATF